MRSDGTLILSTPNANYTKPDNGKPFNPHHIFEYKPEELRSEIENHFALDKFLGQTLDEKIQIPPFYIAQGHLPKDFSTQTKLFGWKILNKMPFKVREGISEAIWKKPFYPMENDYYFKAETIEDAPTLVTVCKKK